jgi:Zn-dependent M28 family amino/carboxypeptidase
MSLIQGKTQEMPWDTIPSVRISREMADAILGYVDQDVESLKGKIEKDLKSQSMALAGVTFTLATKAETKLVSSRNVMGYIEGSDPELKNELVVIGAHLDHLGQRGDYIFNGADDNGSGSVAVMEVAEAFAKNPVKPKRSVVFACWTGEEKGLLGSYYYVSNPTMADKKIAYNINLDMVSRTYTKERLQRMARMMGDLPEGFIDKVDVNKLTRGSFDAKVPEFGEMLKANNQYVGLHLQLSPSEQPSGGSDHFPFAMAKIPYVYFMAGFTEDYHQPSDSIDKVSPKLMERIFRLTYLMANSIANQ